MKNIFVNKAIRTCSAVAAATVLGLSVLSLPAAADSSGVIEANDVTVAKAKQTVENPASYWTKERRDAAVDDTPAVPKSHPSSAKPRTIHVERAESLTASADSVPPKKAAAPTSELSTASTEEADELSVSEVWTGPRTSWPLNNVGKLYSLDAEGKEHQCSASVIVSNNRSTLWTAAHCIHSGEGGQAGFYHDVVFIPAYDGDAASPEPWGVWTANNLIVPTSWAENDSAKYTEADLAAVILDPLPDYGTIQDALGGFGYRFGYGSDYSNVYDFGYPYFGYNRPDEDFDQAKHLMYCQGNVEDAFNLYPLDNRLKMDCDMGKGASGGPMLTGFPQNIKIIGANSHYEEENDVRLSDDLFSSEHGSLAVSVINTVNGL